MQCAPKGPKTFGNSNLRTQSREPCSVTNVNTCTAKLVQQLSRRGCTQQSFQRDTVHNGVEVRHWFAKKPRCILVQSHDKSTETEKSTEHSQTYTCVSLSLQNPTDQRTLCHRLEHSLENKRMSMTRSGKVLQHLSVTWPYGHE